ncbi:MAG: glycoside-pentoside-hexuronide (GPH):cation symporter [Clostridiales bacterium]|nr:glycoside-pentoside-hexuronide (GPH):cation symporter [Clostridiales bacterium]
MAEPAMTLDAAKVKLSNKEKFFFTCGVIGMIVPFNLPLGYLTFFWTDVALIPASIVGTFLMVCKIWDAINDPIIGALADRTNSPKGRYRLWIVPAGILSNITVLMIFITLPGVSRTVQYIYYFVSYFIQVAAFTALELPHLSMMTTLTTDYTERGMLTSWRQTGSQVTMTIIAAAYIPMTVFLFPGNRQMGYFVTTLIFVIAATPFYFLCARGVKERYIPQQDEKVPFTENLKCFKGNIPLLMVMGAHFTHGLKAGLGGAGMYFWTYVAGDILYSAVAMTFGSIGSILGAILMGVVLKIYPNKRNIAIVSWLATAVIGALMYFIDVTTSGGRMMWNIISLINGAIGFTGFVCLFSMVPDVSEYTMAKYGLRAAGFLFAVFNFCFKFAISFGQGILGWIMGAMGYVPNQAQPQSMINFFHLLMTVVPAIITVIGVFFLIGFKINKDTHEELLKTLSTS